MTRFSPVELLLPVRRRRIGIGLLLAIGPALALLAVAARFGVPAVGLAVIAAGAVLLIAVGAWRHARAIDARWITRRLDLARNDLEFSTDLLFADDASLAPLQRLQRARVFARLGAGPATDLRERFPRAAIIGSLAVSLLVAAAALAWPAPTRSGAMAVDAVASGPAAVPARIIDTRLVIAPPAYTGLPTREVGSLTTRAETGSKLQWHLRTEGAVEGMTIRWHDGSTLAFAREDDGWTAASTLTESALYRVVLDTREGDIEGELQRIDAIADTAPEIRVLAPDRTLTELVDGQTRWALEFEARDDYGVGPTALDLTLAQGSGENIGFKEQRIALRGSGEPRLKTFRHQLDLPALGIAPGDDVIVRISVADNRAPQPNVSRSASFILRWPPESGSEGSGIDGMVQRLLPAYFRSQRQIIIDTEALLAQRGSLDADTFAARSNVIGADQQLLRLRYGQFLGEEAETYAAPDSESGDGEDTHAEHADEHAHDHEGEQPAPAAAAGFGAAGNVLETFGHVHDVAEAATLLDPETKRLLRIALGAMWDAELQLRMGTPRAALPHENRALEYIKQVQQANRIYLARVGLELPPVDEARRLTGERGALRNRTDALRARSIDPTPFEAWRALEAGVAPDFGALDRWLRDPANSVPDALSVLAALDAVRADPACVDCRARAQAVLWPLLPPGVAAPAPRTLPDAGGNAYLDAVTGAAP
jgi:hypothetical protein